MIEIPPVTACVALANDDDPRIVADNNMTISQIVETHITQQTPNTPEAENAFFVADLGEIARQHALWRELLPRVEPFYAVKCNPDPNVLTKLMSLGTGFDCASKLEIETVLAMGVHPDRIIYANPCKQSSFISYAYRQGVRTMTFDNADELVKIKETHPTARLVLRVRTDDSKSLCKLGTKFGADPELAPSLLQVAKQLQLDVIGVSFHVGSGCFDAYAFTEAVYVAHGVFKAGKRAGFDFTLLDIGGGFPGAMSTTITFEQVCKTLAPAIDKLFPPNVRVISEPGRFFVSSAFTLCVNVIARRVVLDAATRGMSGKRFMYYVNDGVYGSFNNLMFDHATVTPRVLRLGDKFITNETGEPHEKLHSCSIWGPTCDSIDQIEKAIELPELQIGDWLAFQDMGAYTICAASQFNGFEKGRVLYTTTSLDYADRLFG